MHSYFKITLIYEIVLLFPPIFTSTKLELLIETFTVVIDFLKNYSRFIYIL